MKKAFSTIVTCFVSMFLALCLISCKQAKKEGGEPLKHKILLRSSWQTVNIGDIAHTPGLLTLCKKYLPDVEVVLWASDVSNGVKEMLLHHFPELQIVQNSDTLALKKAFGECDYLLHGSGPWLVESKDVARWVKETGKPFGVYGITLPEERATPDVVDLLNKADFVFFRDSVSLMKAKEVGVNNKIMAFGPDAAFGVELRNDEPAIKFLKDNNLEEGKFLCVIPKYRKTPYWTIPGRNAPYDEKTDKRNQEMKEHDIKPYRDAIIAIVEKSDFKVLVCHEDATQVQIGKEMLYDPLPSEIKKRVVWKDKYWLTDEALSVYVRSAGLFGLEQHSPIMCIANGIPALVGRFHEQTSKGYMWQNIGLGDWLFDSDTPEDMKKLIPTVLSLIQQPEKAKEKTLQAKAFVEQKQKETMDVLYSVLEKCKTEKDK